ncbi:MAG: dUTP pyrophosphatase [Myxococcota bacterium]|jgi:dUTP pyrophosphatase
MIEGQSRPVARVAFARLKNGDGLVLPRPMTENAAGMDLPAAVTEPVTLAPGRFTALPTGFAVEIPPGFEGQVRPRSGLAAKNGVTVLNAPGTIDADYRGEIKVLLINHGSEPFVVERGMRIAQLVIAPLALTAVVEVQGLSATSRGSGGFGSTGVVAGNHAPQGD